MAGKVLPKFKLFFFLSIICMLVNISVCIVALASTNTADTSYFTDTNSYDYQGNIEDDDTNVTALNFATGIGTSFIPFASIVNLVFLDIDANVFIFITIIITIIGVLQTFLLVLIGLCFFPNVLGSGVDV